MMLGKNTKDRNVAPPKSASPRAPSPDISVVASGMRIKGDCETQGQLRIDGKVSGAVRASGLELTASGSVEGDVSGTESAQSNKAFVIGGRVSGSVSARRVEVRGDGVVLGGIIADEAVIEGRVEGGITVRQKLALASTSVVEGEVRARRLSMEEGGQVNGTIHMGDSAAIDTPDDNPEKIAAASRDRGMERDDVAKLVGKGAA